jgi:hypothetical protein
MLINISNDFIPQLSDVLEICARFSVKVTSAIKAPNYRAEATESITEFIK